MAFVIRRVPRRTFVPKQPKDGRLIAVKAVYQQLRDEMADRQKFICALCGRWMHSDTVTFDHEAGRGMGGGRRCDKILHSNGNWKNAAVHDTCNTLKGSQRYHWENGKYVPI